MHTKDQIIRRCCDEKMKVVLDMMELFTRDDIGPQLRSVYKDDEGQELLDPEEILQYALREGNDAVLHLDRCALFSKTPSLHPLCQGIFLDAKIISSFIHLPASKLTMMLQSNSTNLSRSVSSAGEHESSTYQAPPLPKRAETFSGFEGKEKGLFQEDFSKQIFLFCLCVDRGLDGDCLFSRQEGAVRVDDQGFDWWFVDGKRAQPGQFQPDGQSSVRAEEEGRQRHRLAAQRRQRFVSEGESSTPPVECEKKNLQTWFCAKIAKAIVANWKVLVMCFRRCRWGEEVLVSMIHRKAATRFVMNISHQLIALLERSSPQPHQYL